MINVLLILHDEAVHDPTTNWEVFVVINISDLLIYVLFVDILQLNTLCVL